MPEVVLSEHSFAIRYRRPSGGAVRSFDLALRYLNGTELAFTLTVQRNARGEWKVLRAEIDPEETDADIEEAARDLAALQWRIFPTGERGRSLPPLVALWERDGLVLAACLPEKYGEKRLPLARQEEWFAEDPDEDPPDPERFLCWWPDPDAWGFTEKTFSFLRLTPAEEVAVSFFSFSEWFRRPDIAREMDEYLAELEDIENDPQTRAEVMAEIRAEEYAKYLRRFRTILLCYRKKGVRTKVVVGNVRRAEAYFAEKKLDPHDPSAWAAASCVFEPMPDFLLEEVKPCGPLGVVSAGQKLRAAVSAYSHWPETAPGIDLVAAAVFAGARHLSSLYVWLNPLAEWGRTAEKAVDALFAELCRRGVREVSLVDGVFPFEACPHCGGLSLRAPAAWQRAEPVRVEKVGRNAPCPCGSGLKYKKCCGKLEG